MIKQGNMYFEYNQRGNVLFLILIAVVLFAALSYAVTQSSRGGGDASSEKESIQVSQLFQYGTTMSTAMLRMSLRGVGDTDYCFYTGSNNATYNHASCSDDTNNVFHPDGGGVSYQSPPTGVNDGSDWEIIDTAAVWGQGLTDSTAASRDVVMVLRQVPDSVCLEINDKVGINVIPVDNGDLNANLFDGVYTAVDGIDGCPDNCASMAVSPFGSIATHTGCFEEEDTGTNIFFYTLLAR